MPGVFWLCWQQADLDITEINRLTAEAIQTPLKSAKSEYFSKPLLELGEWRPDGRPAAQGGLSGRHSSF